MNVAFDASAILGRSGIERYSRELIKGLLRNNLVDGVTLAASDDDASKVAAYFAPFSGAQVIECLPHERKFGAPLRGLMRLVQRNRMSSAFTGSDIVHLLSPGKVIPRHRPVVTTVHDLFPMYPEMGLDPILVRRFPGRVRRHLEASSAIVCPSAYTASTIREFFPLDLDVIERYLLLKPYILFIGRVDPRKNLHRMMQAWSLLPESLRRHAEFILMIAGGQAQADQFREGHRSVLADTSIRVITDVPTDHMVQLLSQARALAFATLGEGFGLPVLEAMRCGCPVITSQTTSLPEVGGDAALYVDPTLTESIAQRMQQCLEDDALVSHLRAAGLQRSEHFTWDATAQATADVYRSVCG
jgi:alpha-1,3-rhamnosyl/mannosyltransferase